MERDFENYRKIFNKKISEFEPFDKENIQTGIYTQLIEMNNTLHEILKEIRKGAN